MRAFVGVLLVVALASVAPAPLARAEAPLPPEYRYREPQYAIGARVRGIWVTTAMLSSFLATSTSTQNVSLGLEFIYRKLRYDVVTSLDFSFTQPDDGNYLSSGHDPAVDSHYVQFRNLSFLSADVSIIGHTWITNWFEIRYGGGVGLGVVLGDVLLTNNSDQCTLANAGDIRLCHPLGVDLTAPDREAQLKATEQPPGTQQSGDTAQTPHRHVSADKPPVVPVVNLLVGFNFRLQRHLTAQLEVGFRDAIFFGLGAHYWF
ncbi:MAG TPA: hypothetical protein VFF06_29100 [Polyangia bacterium]|nr:hypothetical protein [Polyangia bacterium]